MLRPALNGVVRRNLTVHAGPLCGPLSLGFRRSSNWAGVKMGPPDPILGVSVAFSKDTSPVKINLGVGAYRDDSGKPFILDCVAEAEKRVIEKRGTGSFNHEYLPIDGDPTFRKVALELALGSGAEPITSERAVIHQGLSGTGCLRLMGQFLERHYPHGGPIHLPTPTWGNHNPIFEDAGLKLGKYRYYDAATCGLNFSGMAEDVQNAPNNSIFLFHACAHNPTGVDPNEEQWSELSSICMEKNHFVFFDMAYQGFASGDPSKDAFAVRKFLNDGHNVAISQSFAKNFGLYGQRAGALTILTASAEEAERVDSQLKILSRPMYSNPPKHGAQIVAEVLSDEALTQKWRSEVKLMADRIIDMRAGLVDRLTKLGSTRDWSHVTNQIGMFCFSGLTPEQVDRLAAEYHIFMTRNGRISMAGVTSGNIDHLASSIHAVTNE